MSLAFMLDTDTVSYALRGEGMAGSRIKEHHPSELCVSAITVGELRYGANRRRSMKFHRLIDAFLGELSIMPFDEVSALEFGRIGDLLASRGTPIGKFDVLIAAHAVALDVTLVSNNTKHFSRVPGLKIENWL